VNGIQLTDSLLKYTLLRSVIEYSLSTSIHFCSPTCTYSQLLPYFPQMRRYPGTAAVFYNVDVIYTLMKLIKTSDVFVFITDFNQLRITALSQHILHLVHEKSEDGTRLTTKVTNM
jgi:hypothetical protein